MPERVVIVGGGFGGLYAARSLKRVPVEVTLIDRRNFHLFQPLLYQVATGALSPGEIASPLRAVVQSQRNTRVWMAEMTGLDALNRRVILRDGEAPYDFLILATGSHHHYFGNPNWADVAPGLKTIEDATEIRHRILAAFEHAEREPDAEQRRAYLTFVIVGGGPTGVELAGALAEIANDTLRRDFRTIDPTESRIFLIEARDRILSTFPQRLSAYADHALYRLGVQVRVNSMVTGVDRKSITLRLGNRVDTIPTHTVLWAAGVRASSIGQLLNQRIAAPLDQAGRVIVQPDLSVPGHPEIFVIGDLANYSHQGGQPLPGVAPVAMQQGRYVARLIRARREGRSLGPFRYFDKGNMATIGRNHAVADFGRFTMKGFPAWLAWLFVHLMYLVEFENRLLVLVEWAYNYFTRNRGARLITGGNS